MSSKSFSLVMTIPASTFLLARVGFPDVSSENFSHTNLQKYIQVYNATLYDLTFHVIKR